MRTGAAAGHQGYFHEAVCYGSDEELLAVAVPFLLDGVRAGEPTVVALGERTAGLIRGAIPDASGISFLTGGEVYERPASAIRSYREMMADYVAGGAHQIRIIGEVPRRAMETAWDWWARYESAINHAYDEFPLWSMCAYDTRTTPPHVLADVAQTHPRTATPAGHELSEPYVEPAAYLTLPRPDGVDPIQRTAPLVELLDPAPAGVRRAVVDADPGTLTVKEFEGLQVAASEIVTNALLYGRPPIRVRVWRATDRIVLTVTDCGRGPSDPFAGLLPATRDGIGGLGLWLTHQLCSHVAFYRDGKGFTVQLTAGPRPKGASGVESGDAAPDGER